MKSVTPRLSERSELFEVLRLGGVTQRTECRDIGFVASCIAKACSQFEDRVRQLSGITRHRHPAIASPSGAHERVGGSASNPDAWLARSGPEDEGLPHRNRFIVRGVEGGMDEVEGLVGDAASGLGVDSERPKFGFHPPDPHPELQAAAGEFLNRGDDLGGGECRTVGEDQDGSAELDAVGGGGEPGERSQGIEIASARSLRLVGWDGDVIGYPDRIETGRFSASRTLAQDVGAGGAAHQPQGESESHRFTAP